MITMQLALVDHNRGIPLDNLLSRIVSLKATVFSKESILFTRLSLCDYRGWLF
jgi:hypothetical protein